MADTQSNENNDDDGKPEELLFEILKEVDGFFEQEDRHRFSSRKRMRAIDDSSVSTGGTLIESLRDQLRLSKERIEVVEKRLADVETRNLDLITNAKEREAAWLQEKRDLEAKIYAGKLGDKSKDLNLAKKLRDALQSVKEMKRSQMEWALKQSDLKASNDKLLSELEDAKAISQKMAIENSRLKSEVIQLGKEKVELRDRIASPMQPIEESNRSLIRITQLERSERKLKRRVEVLTSELPEATMLREKNREIEAELASARKKISVLEKEVVTNEHIQAQQKQWNKAFAEILKARCDNEGSIPARSASPRKDKDVSPTAVLLMLRDLQEKESTVLRSKSVADNRVIELEVQLSTLKQRLATRKKMQEKTEENALVMEEKLRRAETQRNFLTKQNEGLKAIIQSYDDENNQQFSNRDEKNAGIVDKGNEGQEATDLKSNTTAANDADKNNNAGVGPGEKLKEYKTALSNANRRLQTTLKEVAACPSPAAQSYLRDKAAKLEIEIQEKDREIEKMKKTLMQMEEKIILLEQRVGRGEFNSATTKVVHLTNNPLSQLASAHGAEALPFEKTLSHLKNILKNNKIDPSVIGTVIQEMMKIPGAPESSVLQSMAEEPSASTKPSKDSMMIINNLKKKNERLKQVFKDLRTKYKNAVYILTGWKIDMDMRSNTTPVVLRSIFAEIESDRLEFQMSSTGGIQLMDTPFANQLDEKVLFYLTTCRSFPAFLSQLTLQLFEKTTMTGTGTISM